MQSKHAVFQELWVSERFQTAKVTEKLKATGNHVIRQAIYHFLGHPL